MALVTQQVQGTYASFPARGFSLNKGAEFKVFYTPLKWVVEMDGISALRCKSCLRLGTPIFSGPGTKFLKIAAFKGSAKNDKSGTRASGSNPAKLSPLQQESDNKFTKSPEQDVQASCPSEMKQIPGSVAIQKLFNNWLTLLHISPPPNEAVDEVLKESDLGKISMEPDLRPEDERANILMSIWGCFWVLNATVKVPLLLFTPLYLAVNVAYGVQVSKELTPLWILGPLIIALYVKFFRGICALYVFAFKQTVKVVKKIPAYSVMAYTFIADGKLKDKLYIHMWQPGMEIMNKNYKEFSVRMMKELQIWWAEKYLDFIEAIWPTYCRTRRFLKRANLI